MPSRFSFWVLLRGGATAAGLLLAVGLLALALALGGYHAVRYVIAPWAGWVTPAQQYEEALRVAVSPVRRLEERQDALERLLRLESYARTLPVEQRASAAGMLSNVALNDLLPLDLRYAAARAQAMVGVNTPKTPASATMAGLAAAATATATAKPADHDVAAERKRLAALVQLQGPAFREASAERTRLIVTLVRLRPCDPELLQWVRRLARHDGVGAVERSFLYGIQAQSEATCS